MFQSIVKLEFLIEPSKTHEIEYYCDRRKDRCLKGNIKNSFATVRIKDTLKRNGILKVVSVICDENIENKKIYLHPNLLCDAPNSYFNKCDEYGVANYEYQNPNGEIDIELKGLTIRHCKIKEIENIIENWYKNENRFDPLESGYNSNSNYKYNLQSLRLCCQAIFNDNNKSDVILSDKIFNSPADLKIEYCNEGESFKCTGGSLIYIFVRKISKNQREICARVFDNTNWLIENIEAEYKHHDYAFVFKIPPYKNINITKDVEFYFQIYTKNNEFYSEIKKFKYHPVELKE